MDARLTLPLLVSCFALTGNGVARAAEGSNGSSCLQTIISNNGDSTKFSFKLNHLTTKVTHCKVENGEKESWTIATLDPEDSIQGLSLDAEKILKTEGKCVAETNTDLHQKLDQLVEAVARLEKRIEEIASSSPTTVAKVDTGYKKIGNLKATYKMHPVGSTWVQAKSICEQEGAHLLVINNAEERDVVTTLFNQTPNIQCSDWNDWAWIGVHDSMSEGDFWTVLGNRLSSVGYAYWVTGRPILNTKENCVSVDKRGAMYDSECGKKAPFICELSRDAR